MQLVTSQEDFIKAILQYLLGKNLPENERQTLVRQLEIFSQPSSSLLSQFELFQQNQFSPSFHDHFSATSLPSNLETKNQNQGAKQESVNNSPSQNNPPQQSALSSEKKLEQTNKSSKDLFSNVEDFLQDALEDISSPSEKGTAVAKGKESTKSKISSPKVVEEEKKLSSNQTSSSAQEAKISNTEHEDDKLFKFSSSDEEKKEEEKPKDLKSLASLSSSNMKKRSGMLTRLGKEQSTLNFEEPFDLFKKGNESTSEDEIPIFENNDDEPQEDIPDFDFKNQVEKSDEDSFDPDYESPDVNSLQIGKDQNANPNYGAYTAIYIIP